MTMLTLINTNQIQPPIAPVGLDYIAGALRSENIDVDILDLSLADDSTTELRSYFAAHNPELIGLSFRNVDDCFWPSAQWFAPDLKKTVNAVRNLSFAPIVLGGVGFSIFPEQIVRYTDVEFGIRGDGEKAILLLLKELRGKENFENIPGLTWRKNGKIHSNTPAWQENLSLTTDRNSVDNPTYFKKAGQCGLETKRGCNRNCIYCADPLAKGTKPRTRQPEEVADEVQNLLEKNIEVLHLCDSEFNVPYEHALAVCREFSRRNFANQLKWYTYMATVPFDAELAKAMSEAGCAGIDFTADSANTKMLRTYRHQHTKQDIEKAVTLCKNNGIKVMLDLLIGGPGETPQTAKETIDFVKKIDPDCAGAALGIRLYPNTAIAGMAAEKTPLDENPNIHRNYDGPIDLLKPTFYISENLGANPAQLIKDLIDGDKRFFFSAEPAGQKNEESFKADYNYNQNKELIKAIEKGARGAYWDILRKLRTK